MCAGAIMQARMRHLYFAASDPKSGALGGKFNLYKEDFNHTVGVTCGILESESKQLIQTFFKKLREKIISHCGIAIQLVLSELGQVLIEAAISL